VCTVMCAMYALPCYAMLYSKEKQWYTKLAAASGQFYAFTPLITEAASLGEADLLSLLSLGQQQ
jgi:hypothetical protein